MQNQNKEDWSKILPEDPQGVDALWEMSSGFGESADVDVSKAWVQFEQKLSTHQSTHQIKGRRFNWKTALTAVAAAVAMLFMINYFAGGSSVIEYANTSVSATTLLLDDQTEVTLSEGATLSVRMEDDVRLVELVGEAFFDVAPNVSRPFKLTTPELDLVVVGTEFIVRSGTTAIVEVREGHVRVRGRNEADWTDLFAGDQVSIKQSLVVEDLKRVVAPGTPLRFDAVQLSQVVKSIEDAHDIKLLIPSKLADCSITADFSKNSVMEIASSLAVLFNADMRVDGQTVELKGGRCQ